MTTTTMTVAHQNLGPVLQPRGPVGRDMRADIVRMSFRWRRLLIWVAYCGLAETVVAVWGK